MINTLIQILIIGFISVAAVGLHHVWKFATYQGNILGFVDRWIVQLEAKEKKSSKPFIYELLHKSLGSCAMCNRQRFADFLFIAFILFTHSPWWTYLFYYMLLTGLTMYLEAAYQFLLKKNNPSLKKNTQTL